MGSHYIYIYIVSGTQIGEIAQLAGAVEYTDCISADGGDSSNECSRYTIKTVFSYNP